MDVEFQRLVNARDEKGLDDLYFNGDCQHFVSVDWREDDADIASYCAESLGIDDLSAEWQDEDLLLAFGQKTVRVPLEHSDGDRHITLCAINDLLDPQYMVRFFIGSHGSDTAGLVILPSVDWQALERDSPLAVKENFLDPRTLPNIFTELVDDTIPEPAKGRFQRMLERNRRK